MSLSTQVFPVMFVSILSPLNFASMHCRGGGKVLLHAETAQAAEGAPQEGHHPRVHAQRPDAQREMVQGRRAH